MNEIYWISVISQIDIAVYIIWIVALIVLICWLVAYGINALHEEELEIKAPKWWLYLIFSVFFTMDVFLPCKKTLYTIFGVGAVIDYVQESDTVKEIPDKAILCIDKLLDEYLSEEDNGKD